MDFLSTNDLTGNPAGIKEQKENKKNVCEQGVSRKSLQCAQDRIETFRWVPSHDCLFEMHIQCCCHEPQPASLYSLNSVADTDTSFKTLKTLCLSPIIISMW